MPLPGALLTAVLLLTAAAPPAPAALSAQATPEPIAAPADTARLERPSGQGFPEARAAQVRFERLRRQWSPVRLHAWLGSDCDERIGRICLRYDEGGDWWPEPEDPRIEAARRELLASLEAVAARSPGDPRITGLRVLYLSEAGLWAEAEALARGCLEGAPAECGVLLGYALHGQLRYVESEDAFRAAIAAMPEDERGRWTDFELVLDGRARSYLESLGEEGAAERQQGIERLWRLADPLYLVPGNDRLTEHWSRLTVSRIRDGIANPYGLTWGRDLEEVVVRFGWEVGWDRVADRYGIPEAGLVGHHHPESRSYVPPGALLADPAMPREAWRLSPVVPREAYAPAYAPVILPVEGELLRFPRGERLVLVATFEAPRDTSHHAAHGHPPFEPPAGVPADSALAGLFLLPFGGGEAFEARTSGSSAGVLMLEAPAGVYVASTEVWLPARGFAGRAREGVVAPALSADLPTLSDLVLLERVLPDSADLEDAVAALRTRRTAEPEENVVVGWEVHGLGRRDETLSYRLSLRRTGGGVIRRLGRWLGLGGDDEPLRVTWEEGGPVRPGPSFRSLSVQIPRVPPGDYLLELELSAPGQPTARTARPIRVGAR